MGKPSKPSKYVICSILVPSTFTAQRSKFRPFGYGQFIPSSFNAFATDGNGDGVRQPYAWADVFASVGNYLVKNGYPVSNNADTKQVYKSVYAYNHADNYVKAVLELQDKLKKNILKE